MPMAGGPLSLLMREYRWEGGGEGGEEEVWLVTLFTLALEI